MTKMKVYLPLLALMLIMAACGNQGEDHDGNGDEKHGEHESNGDDMSMEALEVKVEGPQEVNQGEKVTFTAKVTQGDETVEDADEVMFEIWKEGSKNGSQMVKAEHDGEGMYSIKTSFDAEGKYVVQSHVTARSMHTMPKKQVTVTKSE
ncbi:FixH family protein [Pseudalkalibacillus sp. SCS-8]|uniref:FixH family protein n=1 Tax=Pseudalkalibacillus nanhaiensis TaxID=3115291 RepID=UPI0032DB57E0